MMKKAFLGVLLAGLALPVMAKEPKIVATTSDLASVARAVAGEGFIVKSITTGKEDPHFLTSKPSYILDARDADLWIRVGMDLEIGWEPEILRGSRNPRIQPGQKGHLDASDFVRKLDVRTERVTRAEGDVHPYGNPHFWPDPWNMRQVAAGIADRLAILFPEKADAFKANAQSFQKELDERMFGSELPASVGADALWKASLDGDLPGFLSKEGKAGALGGWAKAMEPLRGAAIVTHHKSWEYVAERFGMQVAETLEPVAGVPPSPGHLAKVKSLIREQNVRVVALEPFYSDKAARNVAAGSQARVVVCTLQVGGEPEASDYFSLMDLIVRRLTEV